MSPAPMVATAAESEAGRHVSPDDFVLQRPVVPDMIAWVDVETSGLDASSCELLEVACIITDIHLNEVADPFHAVIQHSDPAAVRADAVDFVKEMHDRTGLWERLVDGTPKAEVDRQLLAHIADAAPLPRQARLAGNSIRLDLNFLEAHLPATYGHLHYRSVDVTGLFTAVSWWFGMPDVVKTKTHTALDDIRESINEARNIRDFLANLNIPTPTTC